MKSITNLVFQGGSVKSLAYIGVLKTFEAYGIDFANIKRVAGTSAGALIATALAVGCSIERIEKLLNEFDFKAILDDGPDAISTQNKVLKSVEKHVKGKSTLFSVMPVKAIAPVLVHREKEQFGIYQGEFIRLLMEKLIQDQVKLITNGKESGENLTFQELHRLVLQYPGKFRDLIVVGANLTTGKKILFRDDDPETANVIISDAVRISVSIPGVFKPHHVYYKEQGERVVDAKRDIWVDGGLYDNYPIDCFDDPKYLEDGDLCRSADGRRLYNPQTLGFRLVSKEVKEHFEQGGEAPRHHLDQVLDYGKTLTLSVRGDLQKEHYAYPENVIRTVYIDHKNINSLEFNLTEDQRGALILSGQEASENYLHNHIETIIQP